MPTDKEVSCSSSCPHISHGLGQHTLQSTWVTPSVQERLQDHHKGPQEGSGWPRSTNSEAAAEAECPAPAPQGATADDAALWDTAQRIVSEAVRRAVAQIVAAGQEPEEQQDLAQRMDLQDENSKAGCQGGDTIHSIWINPSVQEHLQDAPAGPQEGSGLPSCTDTEAAAEAERPAPAQHSPTEDDVDLSDIVEYIVSEAVRRAEAEIQGPGQQPVEQKDLAQCTDVPMAAPAPAGLEAIEAHLAGEAVHEIINQALEKLEEMQVPMPDYALKSAGAVTLYKQNSSKAPPVRIDKMGAAIILSKTSPSLRTAKAKVFLYSLPVMDYMRSPELILEPDNHPGNCWPFPGSQGHVFIKLSMPVVPRAVTMAHVSGTAFHGESISRAPKDFAVYGFKEEHEEQGTFLGQFTFLAALNPSQTFQLKNELPGVVNYIRLEVLSNWGHPDYTCLYRFRVHGRPPIRPRLAWQERPPSRPRVAWQEEVGAPQEVTSPPQPNQLDVAQPPQIDAGWLPVYEVEPEHMDSIVSFDSSPEKDEEQKMEFLKCIAMIFRATTYDDLSQGLDLFCQGYELAENNKVLLEEEPRDQLPAVVQRIATFAMAEMSFVEEVLEGKDMSHIQACFSSVFMLPSKEEMRGLKPYLYFMTMKAVDSVLVALALNSPASKVNEKMQDIFQMLLTFTTSERASVRERAVGRMRVLSFLLANYSSLKADPNEDGSDSCAEIEMPILGQLLGHLLLFLSFKEEETSCLALDTLCFLFQFKRQQHCATLPEENAQLQEEREASITSLTSSPSATHITKLFAEYLQPSERTDMVLVFIEAMTNSSTFDKVAARNMLGMVKRNCDFWLVDVPKITSCIHKALGCINTAPARRSLMSLIVWMADKCPGEVVSTLLTIAPPGDSTALALWEVMFSVPHTLQNVLKELLIQLQDRHYRVLYTHWVDTAILRLAILASSDLQDEEFAPMYLVMRFLRQRRPVVLSLLLRAMMTLSQRGEMARKMKVMLPDLMWVLQYGNKAIKIKALVVFRNVMAQLEREEASPIAVRLAEFLLPFFDDELSQLRKISISLFRDLMKMVVGNDKSKMKITVRRGLLPLFFRMSDQVQSVAKVAREALLGAAELLKWKQLKDLVQAQQKWRIGESLLEQDRSRAEEYLSQSLLYLGDAQASLREAALRFIAIQPLEEDSEPSICSLAAQTIVIVCSSWKRPRSRWTLRALCCWR
ncbi:hypothetical protein Q9233_009040 [Columba guinea]|nr:hypothetical protein Q9233_009040 [Columba guinea]